MNGSLVAIAFVVVYGTIGVYAIWLAWALHKVRKRR